MWHTVVCVTISPAPRSVCKGWGRSGLRVGLWWQTARLFSGNWGRQGVVPLPLSPYPVLRSDDCTVYTLHNSHWMGIRLAVHTVINHLEHTPQLSRALGWVCAASEGFIRLVPALKVLNIFVSCFLFSFFHCLNPKSAFGDTTSVPSWTSHSQVPGFKSIKLKYVPHMIF